MLRQFRIVFNVVRTHFQHTERLAGASGAQVWALHVIGERPGLGVGDLARAMDVRQPTASAFVKALARLELIDARRDGADRRSVHLYATALGRRALRKAPGPFAGILPQALAALGPQTLAQLDASLAMLIRQLGADAAAVTARGARSTVVSG